MPLRREWREPFRELAIEPRLGLLGAAPAAVHLTVSEQVVLGLLLRLGAAAQEALATALWGNWLDPPECGDIVLRVHILRLRRKLEAAALPAVIECIRGWGYRLVMAGSRRVAAASEARAGRGEGG